MSEEPKETVELVIAGRTYPVVTTGEESAKLEAIAEEINQQLLDVQLRYADRDKQDCLAMTLLQYAVQLRTTSERLRAITARLDSIK